MTRTAQACGGWTSDLGSADLVRGALRLSAPRWHGVTLFWLEARPQEGGRQVIMAGDRAPEGLVDLREMSPPEANVRTRVHEYGGGEYTVAEGRVFFVDDRDRGIYVSSLAPGAGAEVGPAQRLSASTSGSTAGSTQAAGSDEPSCFADLVCSPDGRFLIAVEERTRPDAEPENRLVVFSLPRPFETISPTAPRVVASGHDFYASPVFSPKGDELAFLAWDHPAMPWTGTWLETLAWDAEGAMSPARLRAGGPNESVFQPRYSESGQLFAVSDASGFWNLVAVGEQGTTPVHRDDFELGRAQWVFGQSSWDFLSSGQVIASATVKGQDQLIRLDLETGRSETIQRPYCQVGGIAVQDGWLACLAGAPDAATALFAGPVDAPGHCVRQSSPLAIDPRLISLGEPQVFEGPDGERTHAFVYTPQSPHAQPRPGELPPLLIKSHGGPTSATSNALDPRIQFWTTRGFAVADVNYRGSTGYGRSYRDALAGAWGEVDVDDCVAVARSLAERGVVDGDRLAISGGSAGGFTTLCALTFHSVFSAGASHYGIGDLEALVRDTHKFESRYTDWLVGPWPEAAELYRARSPIHHQAKLDCPMIFFQGLEDRVVPPNQAEAMVAVLAERGIPHAYVPFEGEQHGFRQAENIRTALDGELYFYSKVFGFDAPRPGPVQLIESK